jgi:hypothetical protein
VLQQIDERNAQDPRRLDVEGTSTPYELAYSTWLTSWVSRLRTDPDEASPTIHLPHSTGVAISATDNPPLVVPHRAPRSTPWRTLEHRGPLTAACHGYQIAVSWLNLGLHVLTWANTG